MLLPHPPSSMDRDLDGRRSGDRPLDRGRGAAAERGPRADRFGELGLARRARGAGLGADEQVRRGLPGQALLRRLRVRGQGRAARDRPREGALRRPSTPTSSPTRAPRPTCPSTSRRLKPGDTILGMDLSHGGHLTHGHPLSFSGREYKVVAYGVRREDERIDYDALARARARAPAQADHRGRLGLRARDRLRPLRRRRRRGRRGADVRHRAHRGPRHRRPAPLAGAARALRDDDDAQDAARPAGRAGSLPERPHAKDLDRSVFPGVQGGPLEHVIAAKAVAFAEAATPEFVAYQKRVVENARALAAGARRGADSASCRAAPTTTSMLVDVGARGISGKDAEKRARAASGITVNKNTIPFDTRRRWSPPGIRIGTPAVTTRGMGPAEMEIIARRHRAHARGRRGRGRRGRSPAHGLGALRRVPAGVTPRARPAAAAAAVLLLAARARERSRWAELPRRVRFLVRLRAEGARRAAAGRIRSRVRPAVLLVPRERAAPPASGGPRPWFCEEKSLELHRYLATYYLAPLPVYADAFSEHWELPRDWLIAVYGQSPAERCGCFRTTSGGRLARAAEPMTLVALTASRCGGTFSSSRRGRPGDESGVPATRPVLLRSNASPGATPWGAPCSSLPSRSRSGPVSRPRPVFVVLSAGAVVLGRWLRLAPGNGSVPARQALRDAALA